MLTLSTLTDYLVFLAIAAGGGAFGGVIYELLLQRGRDTGALATPRRHASYLDLGWGASVIVGVAAAIIILYVLAPIAERTDAQNVVTRSYDLIKLIPLSILAGSAGPTVISALQARVVAALEAQRADDTADTATAQLEEIERSLGDADVATTESTRASMSQVAAKVTAAKAAIASLRAEP